MGKMSYITKALVLAVGLMGVQPTAVAKERQAIKIAMLHLALKYADLEHNSALIKSGIELAATQGANWVMTPELSHTGYRFDLKIGTDWISDGPDQYVQDVCVLVVQTQVSCLTRFSLLIVQAKSSAVIERSIPFQSPKVGLAPVT